MARLFGYKCKRCGYIMTAHPKGQDVLMSGEVIETPIPNKCPECGGELEKTGLVIHVD